ncbi:MAG TPA: hypothetical protein VGR07_11930 [Thermoanaerobaculia bacterium]|jgi:hypothetical protein|nr:hypothetical protein [Thermoanaerobaculia bacterium]
MPRLRGPRAGTWLLLLTVLASAFALALTALAPRAAWAATPDDDAAVLLRWGVWIPMRDGSS